MNIKVFKLHIKDIERYITYASNPDSAIISPYSAYLCPAIIRKLNVKAFHIFQELFLGDNNNFNSLFREDGNNDYLKNCTVIVNDIRHIALLLFKEYCLQHKLYLEW